jgi:type I restriction enzyme S subunit
VKLGELLEVTSSKRIFLSDYVEVGIPFYRGKEIILKSKKGIPVIIHNYLVIESKINKKSAVYGTHKRNFNRLHTL